MCNYFLESIKIENVRHLKDITIHISEYEKRHLFIIGKNGCGKTSLLKAISKHLYYLTVYGGFEWMEQSIKILEIKLKIFQDIESERELESMRESLRRFEETYQKAKCGIELYFNVPGKSLDSSFMSGKFVLAYYEVSRFYTPNNPKSVEKISLDNCYGIYESPGYMFLSFLLDLKMTESSARTSGEDAKAEEIKVWFDNFESVLKKILDDETVELIFDEETLIFSIIQKNRNPVCFNELSDGYSAILGIVVDLMIRMQDHAKGRFIFDVPGIVIIDEIEAYLHIKLQNTVMNILFELFPNVQFIVSTYSPFVLNSVKDAVVYDLDNKTLV